MNITEAVAKACECETLVQALSWIAIWENDRVVKQALENTKNNIRDKFTGALYDTCFEFCFKEVMEKFEEMQWQKKNKEVIDLISKIDIVEAIALSKKISLYTIIVKEHVDNFYTDKILDLELKLNVEFTKRAYQKRPIEDFIIDYGELIWLRD